MDSPQRVGDQNTMKTRQPEGDERSRSARRRNAAIIALVGIGLACTVFMIPSGRVTEPAVKLVTSFIWPIVVLMAIVLYQPQAEDLLAELAMRIRGGSALKFLGFELQTLPEQARRIPSPSTEQKVTLKNITLLHTSFFSEEGTRRYGGDGRAYYQFEVVVMAPDAVMERVERVVYHLEDAWPKELRTKVINDRASRFKMKDLANGTSIVVADVYFRDDDQPLQLNRFIDLRLDGPRI